MTPSVAPGSKVGRRLRPSGERVVGTSVMRRPAREDLTTISQANSIPVVRRLRREDGVAAEGTESAVEVADGNAEEDAADGGENRVAEIAVERRHGSGLDGAGEAVAHDEVVAFVEFWEEARKMFEVVAGVGVGHEDVLAARGLDTGDEGGAVATRRVR